MSEPGVQPGQAQPQPRYTRLAEFEPDTFTPGCPVMVERGGVLRDNRTGEHYLQLKLCNNAMQNVRSVRLTAACLDGHGAPLPQRITAAYPDVDCPCGGSFGARHLVALPDGSARRFLIAVEEVVLDDGQALRFSPADLKPRPARQTAERPEPKPSPAPQGPTALGAAVDAALDIVTPACIAQRMAARIPKEEAPKKKKTWLNVLRSMALAAELCLLLSLVSCGESVYTGVDILKQTARLYFYYADMWGQAALAACAVLCAVILCYSFVKKRPALRGILHISGVIALLDVMMLAFYTVCERYKLLAGAYLLSAVYLALLAASILGRAAELAGQDGAPDPAFPDPVFLGPPIARWGLFVPHLLFWLFAYGELVTDEISFCGTVGLALTLLAVLMSGLRSRRAVVACKLMVLMDVAIGAVPLLYSLTYSHKSGDLFAGVLCLALAVASPLLIHWNGKIKMEAVWQ